MSSRNGDQHPAGSTWACCFTVPGRGTAMKKVFALTLVTSGDTAPPAPQLPAELVAALGEVSAAAREGLLALSVATGMAVMQAMFDAEIAAVVGP